MNEKSQKEKQDGEFYADAKWLKPHRRMCDWFGSTVSQLELTQPIDWINAGDGDRCPRIVIMQDGTVVQGWVTVCAYRALELSKIPASYRVGNEDDLMATAVVAEVVRDAYDTRRLHDLAVAEAFRQFCADSRESMAELQKMCGLDKCLRTWRRKMELLGLGSEVRAGIEKGTISRAQGKLINGLPGHLKESLAAALRRGEDARDALIDCGVINDDHGLSPHESACRTLNLFDRYLSLWRENPKGFRSAYVLAGTDKLELIRGTIEFLTYIRDQLINDQRRASSPDPSKPTTE